MFHACFKQLNSNKENSEVFLQISRQRTMKRCLERHHLLRQNFIFKVFTFKESTGHSKVSSYWLNFQDRFLLSSNSLVFSAVHFPLSFLQNLCAENEQEFFILISHVGIEISQLQSYHCSLLLLGCCIILDAMEGPADEI